MRQKNNKTRWPVIECRKLRAVESGFTLLETTIAMLVMTIVGLGVASAFFYAVSNTANAADREMAMAVAQQRLEQLRSVAFTDSTMNATPTPAVTTVTRAGRTFSITTTIADANVVAGQATLKTVTIKVIPQASSQSWTTANNSLFGSVTLVTERSAQWLGPNRSL